ncbi:MAG: 2-oxoacid:acceptor oxidoreductase family protein [Dethiobacter sp.]|jgi:2-oxoglutarate ferredoxin oxidoreductase subunit gamma|nr:2-oxoacid:acceptor oxidoreductase family protein [Dethiobacter sp.]
MSRRREYRLSGSGGQGLILAAIILAEAAASEGGYVVQTQSYGPEARGGASKAEVITDEEEISYPKVSKPDFVLAMSENSYRKYGDDYKDDGILLVDSTFVRDVKPTGKKVVALPITKYTREKLGKEIVANIVALGVINGLAKIVSNEVLKKAVLSRAPKGTEEINTRALELGLSLAKEAK